jgi:hypothetical protein
MKSIAAALDSGAAKGTEGKVGTCLSLVNYHANPTTSAMFPTATRAQHAGRRLHRKGDEPGPPAELDELGAVHGGARRALPAADAARGLRAVAAARAECDAERGRLRARRTAEEGPGVAEGARDAAGLLTVRRTPDPAGVRRPVHADDGRRLDDHDDADALRVFGSGYVTTGNWWRFGFVMCAFELAVFALVGGVWWKVLGCW